MLGDRCFGRLTILKAREISCAEIRCHFPLAFADEVFAPQSLSEMAMRTETYMDRRLSVPLCTGQHCSHHTNKQEISESGRDTRNRTAKPIVDV
jgi:hypothetical protein